MQRVFEILESYQNVMGHGEPLGIEILESYENAMGHGEPGIVSNLAFELGGHRLTAAMAKRMPSHELIKMPDHFSAGVPHQLRSLPTHAIEAIKTLYYAALAYIIL